MKLVGRPNNILGAIVYEKLDKSFCQLYAGICLGPVLSAPLLRQSIPAPMN